VLTDNASQSSANFLASECRNKQMEGLEVSPCLMAFLEQMVIRSLGIRLFEIFEDAQDE
jgi:hypothetical protein